MKKRGKAQVSLEFLIVVAFALMITIPLVIIFYQQSESINTEVSASQIDKVASEMRDAADEVYYLGAPSKKTITIYMPEGVNNVTLRNNTIIFSVDAPINDYELVKWTAANLTGSIKSYSGIHHVSAEAYDTYVNIVD